ncbi:hypothetical protein B0H14DRAFT_3592675 [Mycena olivaceomarginata]|nr:hypothetical protein B0H14DRAFT_3592675 [Mycena olivaceomarginata]
MAVAQKNNAEIVRPRFTDLMTSNGHSARKPTTLQATTLNSYTHVRVHYYPPQSRHLWHWSPHSDLCTEPLVLCPSLHTFGMATSRAEEMKGVKDQSIGILAIAFAILISTIIEATGQGLTNFHAAVILDLSWMNNTSTWIWFLLYAHSLTKSNEGKDSEKDPSLQHGRTGPLFCSPLFAIL